MAFLMPGFSKLRKVAKPCESIHRAMSRHVRFSPSTLVREQKRKELLSASESPFQNFMASMRLSQREIGIDGTLMDLSARDSRIIRRVASILWHCMDTGRKQKYVDMALAVKHRQCKRLPPDPYKQRTQLGKRSRRPRSQHILH